MADDQLNSVADGTFVGPVHLILLQTQETDDPFIVHGRNIGRKCSISLWPNFLFYSLMNIRHLTKDRRQWTPFSPAEAGVLKYPPEDLARTWFCFYSGWTMDDNTSEIYSKTYIWGKNLAYDQKILENINELVNQPHLENIERELRHANRK